VNPNTRFIFFSKSYWREPPRLRHQVANLLLDHGHQVVFFEKPDFLLGSSKNEPSYIEPMPIDIRRTRQLIHHQLRISNQVRYLNAEYEKKSINKAIDIKKESNSVILNFNYDYYFLRDLFPTNKIITIINDDFVAQSRINKGRHVLDSLEETCRKSDAVFVVSYPLMRQVEKWCNPQIFFPWADRKYKKPKPDVIRDSVLLWAFINQNFDLDLLRYALSKMPSLRIDIVGPVEDNFMRDVESFSVQAAGRVRLLLSRDLDQLNLDKYACSIIPYKENIKYLDAVSASNKTFRLLSFGLPLVASGLPNFLKHESIINCSSYDCFVRGIQYFEDNFYNLQLSISKLVALNQPGNRYNQIMSIINN